MNAWLAYILVIVCNSKRKGTRSAVVLGVHVRLFRISAVGDFGVRVSVLEMHISVRSEHTVARQACIGHDGRHARVCACSHSCMRATPKRTSSLTAARFPTAAATCSGVFPSASMILTFASSNEVRRNVTGCDVYIYTCKLQVLCIRTDMHMAQTTLDSGFEGERKGV